MDTVGIYVDGMNIDLGLKDAGEPGIQLNIGSILNRYAEGFGTVLERYVYIDDTYNWVLPGTEMDLQNSAFDIIEVVRFYHKSLSDFHIGCHIVDRIHDKDCPDILVLGTGDKDFMIVLDYVYQHNKRAAVIAEEDSLAAPLVQKCQELDFDCRSVQLFNRSIRNP